METIKSKKLIVFTSWQTVLFIVLFPLFFLTLDTISAIWSKTQIFSNGALNITCVFFALPLIAGIQLVVITDKALFHWRYIIAIKRLPLYDISKIEAKVDIHYSNNTVLTPIGTMHFYSKSKRTN